MTKKADLSKVLTKDHERKWVALTRDHSKVIAYDENLVRLSKQIHSNDVVYMKVPPSDAYLSF